MKRTMFTETELPVVYLKPGEVHFSVKPAVVMTLLGSCISLTMFSARLRLGGVYHVLLPRCREDSCPGCCDESYHYVDCCIMGMVGRFARIGVSRGELEIKVFGGSDILGINGQKNHASVGKQNIMVAKDSLRREGLEVSASHIGGTFGRKIFFFAHTGAVFMKRIRKNEHSREEAWRH
jgi:chemotaxis protein CheD